MPMNVNPVVQSAQPITESEIKTAYKYPEHLKDEIVSAIYQEAQAIAQKVVSTKKKRGKDWDAKLDAILTSRITGYPIMFLLLGAVFWITISGANLPSSLLSTFFFTIEDYLTRLFTALSAPEWLHGILVLGVYRTLAWVVSVMLPPMAIFFPCFTLLEDFGYLPRVAFNLDRLFQKAGAHGKQSLTMSMGFGCTAAGVIACRIIESPRERLIAM
ncbi:MAG TPA: ferrous iron transporter B, partial [Clostridiales bacterium]|nr:ferrous iron transporter B [Clostridiales bacterium]